ncbi:methyltransferase domain-containing protein [Rhodococcus zopfii]|uniref:methyltransferase domain-containing protein n=1 Tax=Rhodococcus zopfii TaxID=43772 RepID=UPI000933BB8F|nr:methyltransferase domain-containing protein [Rhodococcus zopfii]
MNACRGCGMPNLQRVLDLGQVPAADDFPRMTDPVRDDEISHFLAMDMCTECGLAQLADDDTTLAEPRGIEPQALEEQAAEAVRRVRESGRLRGATVREYGSPHGGTWLPLLAEHGFTPYDGPADIVIDSLGIMHDPDQRAAFAERAAATAPDGLLLLHFHTLSTIVRLAQWNALRHGHFAYYSAAALIRLLDAAGMRAVEAWTFDLYGGTVLLAAVHGRGIPGGSVQRVVVDEAGAVDPSAVRGLQHAADDHARSLRTWLEDETRSGHRVYAYGAASRAVALFHLAGIDRTLVTAVADAAPGKQGRRMPGTDVPIISPEELVSADPDRVVLTLPDLLPEVRRRYPALAGRWRVDGPGAWSPSRRERLDAR